MRNKLFFKSVALVVCLAILGITASGLLAVEKRTPRLNARLLLKNPFVFLSSFFPMFSNIFDYGRDFAIAYDGSDGKTKPAGDISGGRPSDQD